METTAPELGPDIERLALAVTMPAAGVVRMRITAADAPRWEVPQWLFAPDAVAGALPGLAPAHLGCDTMSHTCIRGRCGENLLHACCMHAACTCDMKALCMRAPSQDGGGLSRCR